MCIMKFLTVVKKLSDTINCYDKKYKISYSKNNMTNPFLTRKIPRTIIWIDNTK